MMFDLSDFLIMYNRELLRINNTLAQRHPLGEFSQYIEKGVISVR